MSKVANKMGHDNFLFYAILGFLYLASVSCIVAEPKTGICIRKMGSDEEVLKIRKIYSTWETKSVIDLAQKSTVFIDKTLLIKEILEIEQKVVIINCPCKWGKSINLGMLKAFFEIRVHPNTSNIIPPTEATTYKFFVEGKLIESVDKPLQANAELDCITFDPYKETSGNILATYSTPLIAKYKNIVDEYLAQYPVIYVNWYAFFLCNDHTVIEFLRRKVTELFTQHSYLKDRLNAALKNTNLTAQEMTDIKNDLKKFTLLEKAKTKKDLKVVELENSLVFLSRLLYQQFGKPVIMLMDESFTILEHNFFRLEDVDPDIFIGERLQLEEGRRAFRNLTRKTFDENPYLKKAILTGVLLVSKQELFTNASNFVHYNMINNDLQEFYGVTEHELKLLFEYFQIPPDLAQQARQFYLGYRMKQNSDLVAYNVWSIVTFLNTKQIGEHWIERINLFVKLRHWLKFETLGDVLGPMINGSEYTLNYEDLDFDKRGWLFETYFKSMFVKINETMMNSILSHFCELGLLTHSHTVSNDAPKTEGLVSREVRAVIPNGEVKQAFSRQLKKISDLMLDTNVWSFV